MMAVQNALVQISLVGAPSTTVMTIDFTSSPPILSSSTDFNRGLGVVFGLCLEVVETY